MLGRFPISFVLLDGTRFMQRFFACLMFAGLVLSVAGCGGSPTTPPAPLPPGGFQLKPAGLSPTTIKPNLDKNQ
jgi:hypothetical protein